MTEPKAPKSQNSSPKWDSVKAAVDDGSLERYRRTTEHSQAKPLRMLVLAQERYTKAEGGFERAREARDDAIRNASVAGLTRRSVAQATGLTAGRVQQIIDRHR
jgi:hypothetical protein